MTQGIGARIQRKEDARHLHGRGSFVSDMLLPGQSEDSSSPHYSDQRELASWWLYKPMITGRE